MPGLPFTCRLAAIFALSLCACSATDPPANPNPFPSTGGSTVGASGASGASGSATANATTGGSVATMGGMSGTGETAADADADDLDRRPGARDFPGDRPGALQGALRVVGMDQRGSGADALREQHLAVVAILAEHDFRAELAAVTLRRNQHAHGVVARGALVVDSGNWLRSGNRRAAVSRSRDDGRIRGESARS